MKTFGKVLPSVISILIALWLFPNRVEARFLFHATKSGVAPKIMKNGFKASKMKGRIGKKKIYLSESAKTAVREKPHTDTLMRVKKSHSFNKKIIDTTHMSSKRLKRISGLNDMRGTIKNRVVGPKLGHKLGDYANKKRLIVKYKSAKDTRGVNYAVPSSLYREHPRIVRPVGH